MRGIITDEIREKSREIMGYDITQLELRLMPYLMHVLMNDQRISPAKINQDEMLALAKWVGRGYILDGVSNIGRPRMSAGYYLRVSDEFWGILCEMIWMGYVNLER